jgi:hypothetical protein
MYLYWLILTVFTPVTIEWDWDPAYQFAAVWEVETETGIVPCLGFQSFAPTMRCTANVNSQVLRLRYRIGYQTPSEWATIDLRPIPPENVRLVP